MADRDRMWPQNVPGPYYVDQECIDCNLCSEIAPDIFRVAEGEGHDYVWHQPETDAEVAMVEEAMANCPVEAIGSDGDEAATA